MRLMILERYQLWPRFYTYQVVKQCAAVNMWRWSIITPPHKLVPRRDLMLSRTWYGNSPGSAFVPPTILFCRDSDVGDPVGKPFRFVSPQDIWASCLINDKLLLTSRTESFLLDSFTTFVKLTNTSWLLLSVSWFGITEFALAAAGAVEVSVVGVVATAAGSLSVFVSCWGISPADCPFSFIASSSFWLNFSYSSTLRDLCLSNIPLWCIIAPPTSSLRDEIDPLSLLCRLDASPQLPKETASKAQAMCILSILFRGILSMLGRREDLTN